MTLSEIAAVAGAECDRQEVDLHALVRLLSVYEVTRDCARDFGEYPTANALLGPNGMAATIAPDNQGEYRTRPVYFKDLTLGVNHRVIERAMNNWFEGVSAYWASSNNSVWTETDKVFVADMLIKEFLDIHPFTDGNGRLAWIVRTWLLDQWESPEVLPDYYGRVQSNG